MQDEQAFRLTVFLSIISVVVLWEILRPKRPLSQSKSKRWLNNLALVGLDTIVVRILFPVGAVWVAHYAAEHNLGLLNLVDIGAALSIILAIVALDFIIYWQHRLFHAVPWLWRLHQVHHADRDIDVTTGLRFHPIEIMLSMLIKFVAIVLLGAPVLAVILFEVILNGMAMFNHGNIQLPRSLDRVVRCLMVTPDMHRVHHSIHKHETNSNYGFNISLWDRFFNSYHAQPDDGHQNMVIGLTQYQQQPTYPLMWMLKLPFVENGGKYAQYHRRQRGQDE